MNEASLTSVDRLSERQRQCLRLVGRGFTSKDIANELGLSHLTVDQHVTRAIKIVGATTRGEAARILASWDDPHPQKLDTQPAAIAEPSAEAHSSLQARGQIGILKMLAAALFGLPPVGGTENDLKAGNRLAHILRIGFVSAVIMFAILVVASGTIQLLR